MRCFMCVVKCSEVEFHVSTLMPLKSPFKSLLKIFTVHVTFVKRPKLNCQKKPYLGENLSVQDRKVCRNNNSGHYKKRWKGCSFPPEALWHRRSADLQKTADESVWQVLLVMMIKLVQVGGLREQIWEVVLQKIDAEKCLYRRFAQIFSVNANSNMHVFRMLQ